MPAGVEYEPDSKPAAPKGVEYEPDSKPNNNPTPTPAASAAASESKFSFQDRFQGGVLTISYYFICSEPGRGTGSFKARTDQHRSLPS